MIRTAYTVLALLVVTPMAAVTVIAAALLGIQDRAGGVFDRTLRWWASALIRAAGVQIVIHGEEHCHGAQHIFVANHESWCDIPALGSIVPRFKFVAKAELGRVPLFGAGMRAIGSVFIERENRSSSVESLRLAAEKIHTGASVVIFAEGTRGTSYALRPFKKGAFVLAINAQAPIVPVVLHGTIEVLPRSPFRVRAGRVDVHFLEPVPAAGLTYDDRNILAANVRNRMAHCLKEHYGVDSPAWEPRRNDT